MEIPPLTGPGSVGVERPLGARAPAASYSWRVRRRLGYLVSWVQRLRDLCGGALPLLHHGEPLRLGDHPLHVGDHVILDHDESAPVLANILVLGDRDRDEQLAVEVATLTHHRSVALGGPRGFRSLD